MADGDQTQGDTVTGRGGRGEVAALAPGTMLGRYRVEAVLGSGAVGIVYAAHDPQLERKVALKVLRPNPERDEGVGREQLLREAQALAKLSHPNVVAVYDVGVADGQVFVAMEWIDGTTLTRWLAERPRPLRAVLDVFLAAGRGLAAAHAAGLVHRDFKPDNVLVDHQGRVRVSDFGLARAERVRSEAITQDGSVSATRGPVGTPRYMAPEIFGWRAADARSDQFAFCIALHEGLFGVRPFAGSTLVELAAAVTSGQRVPMDTARAPRRIRGVVDRGLSIDPTQRYPSMNALLLALERARRPWLLRPLPLAVGSVLVLALAAFVARATKAAPTRYAERRLTASSTARDGLPALAAVGHQLFVHDADGLSVRELPAGTPAALPLPPGDALLLADAFPDGERVMMVNPADQTLVSWSPAAGKAVPLGCSGLKAALSPDGQRVASFTERGVELCTLGGEGPKVLLPATEPMLDDALAWSPDGRFVATLRQPVTRKAAPAIEVLATDGSSRTVVFQDERLALQGGDGVLGWTEPGALVFGLTRRGSTVQAELWELPLAAGRPAGAPRWLHTTPVPALTQLRAVGSTLVYAGSRRQTDVQWAPLFLRGLGKVTLLTRHDANDRSQDWDEDEVIFISDRAGNWDLYSQSITEGPARLRVGGPAWETWPVLLADRSLLFFQVTVLEDGKIPSARLARLGHGETEPRAVREVAVEPMTAMTGRPPPLQEQLHCSRQAPSRCILGERNATETSFRWLELDGGALGEIAFRVPGTNNRWALSPDATQLAVAIDDLGAQVVSTATASTRPLAQLAQLQYLAWVPDGQSLIASRLEPNGEGSLWRLDLDGGAEPLYREGGVWLGQPTVSGDGRKLAFTTQRQEGDVWLLLPE